MNTEPFVIERTYNAPIADVWAALTDNNKMKEWYFKLADFKAEVGFEFTFVGKDGDLDFTHLCRVTAVEPNKKLAYTWRYDKYEGNSEVTFELFDEGDSTRLKLTHTGLETFPQDNKSFRRESFAAGWTAIIGQNLKNYVEKNG